MTPPPLKTQFQMCFNKQPVSILSAMPEAAKKPKKNDEYYTPKHVWEDILHLLPKDKVIWEAFYGNGQSGKDLRSLGLKVIHNDEDFFEHDRGDYCLSNPAFSIIPKILERLVKLNKPFILIMPASKLNTQYFRKLFKGDDDLQLIIPKKRIHFITPGISKSSCWFDCNYYCWKMNLPKGINWLE